MRFSKSTGCFYPEDVAYRALPADLIDVSQEDFLSAMARAPGDALDVVNGRVVVVPMPAPTAAEIKSFRWDAIKAERDRRKSGGFKVNVGSSNKWFHSDADSRIQHLGLKDKARDLIAGGGQMTDKLTILGQTVKWKTMDGSLVEITAQLAFDIVAAAGDLDAQLFATAETHKAAMEASADPASYDFSAGWPKSFGE
jgi:hypothetical protein